MNKPLKYNREAAEGLAVQALGYLAEDDERLSRFLSLSGIDVGDLRAAARQAGFLAGVLDHVMSDEALLLAFAQHAGLAPEEIAKAHLALAGDRDFYRST
jgi:hypothetical protein